MHVPTVSVVIPAYNAQKTLAATVRSALRQTFRDFEIIIVDDGSTDDTRAIADSFSAPNVRVISKPNGGVADARNVGIRNSRGKYIALLDSDDLWVPHKLERQVRVLQETPEVAAVQSGAYFVDDNLQILSVRPCAPSKDALLETLLFQNMPNNMSTLVIRRDMFDKMGYFDPDLEILEEWDMALKVARHCNLVSIEEPLSLYRVHIGNRSRNLGIHIQPGFTVLDRIFSDPSLPKSITSQKRRVYAHFFTMLSGGSFLNGSKLEAIKWGAKAVASHPAVLKHYAAFPIRRFRRRTSINTGVSLYKFDPRWTEGLDV